MSQAADQIGHSFLMKYYTSLAENPKDLISMYKEDAYMTIPDSDFNGHDEIAAYINTIQPGRKYRIHKVGAYDSVNNSLVVVAKGTMLTRDESMVFNHTFVLVRVSEAQYCIRNDIQTEFQTAAPPAPEAVEEEVVAEPEPQPVEEVVEETPEVVEEPVVQEQAAPAPTPAPKQATPQARPEPTPVKEEKEVFTGSDWASRLRRAPAAAPAQGVKQVVSGGAAPGIKGVQVRTEDKKRGNSPSRRGPRPERVPQFSVYVSMGTSNFKDTDVDGIFKKFGKVLSKTLGTEKQFAFVDFAEKKAADAAIAASEAQELSFAGRHVRVQWRQEEKKAAAPVAPRRK